MCTFKTSKASPLPANPIIWPKLRLTIVRRSFDGVYVTGWLRDRRDQLGRAFPRGRFPLRRGLCFSPRRRTFELVDRRCRLAEAVTLGVRLGLLNPEAGDPPLPVWPE